MKISKLKLRYTRIIAVFTMLAVTLMGVIMMYQLQSLRKSHTSLSAKTITVALTQQMVSRGESTINLLVGNLIKAVYFDNSSEIYRQLNNALKQPNIEYIYIYDSDGNIIHDGNEKIPNLNRAVVDMAFVAIERQPDSFTHARLENIMEICAPLYLEDQYLGGIIIGLSLDGINHQISRVQQHLQQSEESMFRTNLLALLFTTLLLLVSGVVVAGLLADRLTKPIEELVSWTRRIGRGDYEVDVNYRHDDEIKQLIAAFVSMSGQLADYKEDVEGVIRERTEELSVANQQLKEKIVDGELLQEEQLKLQKQLFQAQKMEVIGLMAGGVAHDLNNILMGIVAYPEILLSELPEDSQFREPIISIQEAGQRAADVVADLLTVARGVAASKEFLDIHILIQEYMVSLEHQRIQKLYPNITFETKFEPGPLYIYCSSVHIKKCLMNLAVNAAEAITNSGSITISTAKIRDDGPVSEKTKMPGEQVVLKVTDTGQGIAPEDLEHIFEPFYTKKKMGRSGTGLGLSVVWNTMQDHNGNIRVGNNTIGTTFELVFPAAGEKRDDQDTETIDHIDLQGKGETILVVDDEAQQRYIAATILEKFGYKVEVASSGEFAVAVIEKRGVDLVLLDMVMDPGISGRQTYEEMIKVRPGQKAVVVSGFAEDEDVKRVISLGINHFVKKPYTSIQLGTMIRQALVERVADKDERGKRLGK